MLKVETLKQTTEQHVNGAAANGHRLNGHRVNGHVALQPPVNSLATERAKLLGIIDAKVAMEKAKELERMSLSSNEGDKAGLNWLLIKAKLTRSGDVLHKDNIDPQMLASLPQAMQDQLMTGEKTLLIDMAGNHWIRPRDRMSPEAERKTILAKEGLIANLT